MSLRSWLGSTQSNSRPNAPHRPRLSVESLERRDVPTAVALPSGNVSWWTANSTAADAEGVNNATLSNVSYTTGEVGKAWSFNGTNSWAALGNPSSLAFTSSLSIEGWIKVNSLPTYTSFSSIMFRGDDRGGLDPYQLVIQQNGNLQFGISNASNQGASVAAPITTGQWVHVAATLDDATGLMTLYENGAVVAQTTTTVRPFGALDPTQEPGVGIGNSNSMSNFNVPFNGLIDELSVYNRALTSGEVQGIYKAGSDGKVISPVSVDSPSVVEGAVGTTTPVTFTLTRTGSLSNSLTVNWATADDTATAGSDYVAASGTLTFAAGQSTATVQLTVIGNNVPEPNKDFKLVVTPVGGTAVMGLGTILNDDAAISVGNASAMEGSNTLKLLGGFIPDGSGGLATSNGSTFGPDGNLYVISGSTNSVLRYDGATGAFKDVFVASGSGGLNGPIDQAFGPDGNLYVTSRLSNQVLRYDGATGAFIDVVASNLNNPVGVTFGPDGSLYIANRNSNEVLRYANGSLSTFVPAGSGGLSLARKAVFGPDGNGDGAADLYVASEGSGRILRYDGLTGAFIDTFVAPGAAQGPMWLAFGSDGYLYVTARMTAGSGNMSFLRFNAVTGAFVDSLALNRDGWGFSIGTGNIIFDSSNSAGGFVDRIGSSSLAAFTVSLASASAGTTNVNYSTADGTALAGRDYIAASGTLTFAPGETTKTILVQTLDDGSADPTRAFTVTLSNPTGGVIATGQAFGTILDDTKFYVADGNAKTYQYATTGTALGNNALSDTAPRGVATTSAGTTEWVVDANKTVYVYSTAGVLLGSWTASGFTTSTTFTGITTNGTDIWLVDSYSRKVYKFTGAASRLSGSQSAASSFSLNSKDTNPQDLVTDGSSIWVVDGTALKVFKYNLTGTLLGSWSIDSADSHPTGITINPSNVSDIWIVDNGTDKVYQYVGAATRTSGSQSASATFTLATGDTNPQGIADPPPASSAEPNSTTGSIADSGIPAASILSINPVTLAVTPAHPASKTVTITGGTAQPGATLSMMGLFNNPSTTTTGSTNSVLNEGMSPTQNSHPAGGTVLANAPVSGITASAASVQWPWNDSASGNRSLELDNPLLTSTLAWGFQLK